MSILPIQFFNLYNFRVIMSERGAEKEWRSSDGTTV